MSPSRKAGLIGMIAGGISALAGLAALTLPIIYAKKAMRAQLHDFMVGHPVRREAVSNASVAWVVGAPIGLLALGFGILVLGLALVIYFDAKRKETTKV